MPPDLPKKAISSNGFASVGQQAWLASEKPLRLEGSLPQAAIGAHGFP